MLEVSKTIIDKPRKDGFLPVNPEDFEQNNGSPNRDEELKNGEQKSKSIASERPVSENQSEVMQNTVIVKDDSAISPNRTRDQL